MSLPESVLQTLSSFGSSADSHKKDILTLFILVTEQLEEQDQCGAKPLFISLTAMLLSPTLASPARQAHIVFLICLLVEHVPGSFLKENADILLPLFHGIISHHSDSSFIKSSVMKAAVHVYSSNASKFVGIFRSFLQAEDTTDGALIFRVASSLSPSKGKLVSQLLKLFLAVKPKPGESSLRLLHLLIYKMPRFHLDILPSALEYCLGLDLPTIIALLPSWTKCSLAAVLSITKDKDHTPAGRLFDLVDAVFSSPAFLEHPEVAAKARFFFQAISKALASAPPSADGTNVGHLLTKIDAFICSLFSWKQQAIQDETFRFIQSVMVQGENGKYPVLPAFSNTLLACYNLAFSQSDDDRNTVDGCRKSMALECIQIFIQKCPPSQLFSLILANEEKGESGPSPINPSVFGLLHKVGVNPQGSVSFFFDVIYRAIVEHSSPASSPSDSLVSSLCIRQLWSLTHVFVNVQATDFNERLPDIVSLVRDNISSKMSPERSSVCSGEAPSEMSSACSTDVYSISSSSGTGSLVNGCICRMLGKFSKTKATTATVSDRACGQLLSSLLPLGLSGVDDVCDGGSVRASALSAMDALFGWCHQSSLEGYFANLVRMISDGSGTVRTIVSIVDILSLILKYLRDDSFACILTLLKISKSFRGSADDSPLLIKKRIGRALTVALASRGKKDNDNYNGSSSMIKDVDGGGIQVYGGILEVAQDLVSGGCGAKVAHRLICALGRHCLAIRDDREISAFLSQSCLPLLVLGVHEANAVVRVECSSTLKTMLECWSCKEDFLTLVSAGLASKGPLMLAATLHTLAALLGSLAGGECSLYSEGLAKTVLVLAQDGSLATDNGHCARCLVELIDVLLAKRHIVQASPPFAQVLSSAFFLLDSHPSSTLRVQIKGMLIKLIKDVPNLSSLVPLHHRPLVSYLSKMGKQKRKKKEQRKLHTSGREDEKSTASCRNSRKSSFTNGQRKSSREDIFTGGIVDLLQDDAPFRLKKRHDERDDDDSDADDEFCMDIVDGQLGVYEKKKHRKSQTFGEDRQLCLGADGMQQADKYFRSSIDRNDHNSDGEYEACTKQAKKRATGKKHGDASRKGDKYEPYAYVPLSRKLLQNRGHRKKRALFRK